MQTNISLFHTATKKLYYKTKLPKVKQHYVIPISIEYPTLSVYFQPPLILLCYLVSSRNNRSQTFLWLQHGQRYYPKLNAAAIPKIRGALRNLSNIDGTFAKEPVNERKFLHEWNSKSRKFSCQRSFFVITFYILFSISISTFSNFLFWS